MHSSLWLSLFIEINGFSCMGLYYQDSPSRSPSLGLKFTKDAYDWKTWVVNGHVLLVFNNNVVLGPPKQESVADNIGNLSHWRVLYGALFQMFSKVEWKQEGSAGSRQWIATLLKLYVFGRIHRDCNKNRALQRFQVYHRDLEVMQLGSIPPYSIILILKRNKNH